MIEERPRKTTEEPPAGSDSAPADEKFLALCQSNAKQELLLAGGMLALLALSFQSFLPRLSTYFLGGIERDAGLYVWLVKSNVRDFLNLFSFNTQAFYPYGGTLSWSDNFILPSAAVKVLMAAQLSLPAAYNLVLLTAIFLNGYLTARLAFKLTGALLPAWAAGASFMCLSYFKTNLGHPQLQFAFWLPLGLTFFFAYLSDRRLLTLIGALMCVVGAFLCTVYYAVFLVLLLGCTLTAVLILRPGTFAKRDYLNMLLAALAAAPPLAVIIAPYLEVRNTFGERGIYEAYYFSANLLSWLSAGPFSALYSVTAAASHDEAHLFPGLLLYEFAALGFVRLAQTEKLNKAVGIFLTLFFIGLLCTVPLPLPGGKGARTIIYCGVAAQWLTLSSFVYLLYKVGALERQLKCSFLSNRDVLGVFLFAALFSALLALGPQGNPEKGQYALGVFRLCYELLPGFNSIRAIARIGVVTLFCLSVLFGLTLAHLQAKKKYRYFHSLAALLLLAVLVENHVKIYPAEGEVSAPPIFGEIPASGQDGKALVVLPFTSQVAPDGQVKSWGDFAEKNVRYMHWAFPSRMPLMNGYSGQRSKLMKELPGQTRNFPDQRSLRALSSVAGLRYVVFLPQFSPGYERSAFMAALNSAPELRLIQEDSNGNFLLEFNPNRLINSQSSHLLAPAFAGGELKLKLMALFETGTPALKLEIYDEDVLAKPLAIFELPADGLWHEFNVTLHRSNRQVRPRKLVFRTEGETPVYIGPSEFVMGDS